MAADDGPRGLVLVPATPASAAAAAGPVPTYVNLAHLVSAAVLTGDAGETTLVLDLMGRSLAVTGAAATALAAHLRDRATVFAPGPAASPPPGWPDDEAEPS